MYRRSCSRCRAELTDPASQECGVGPVCRAKDNHLYAKTIPANLVQASFLAMSVELSLPELQEHWNKQVRNRILKFSRKHPSTTEFVTIGDDAREVIKAIDWCLSHDEIPGNTRSLIISLVEQLGYVGLAAVLRGEASLSKARVWFDSDTGKVLLEGKSCTAGYYAIRKIPGSVLPFRRGSKTPYSVPAKYCAEFLTIVRKHWPMYESKLDAVQTAADQWLAANPVASTQANDDVQIAVNGNKFTLNFSWKRGVNMYTFIDQLKRIPKQLRNYNPVSKAWTFDISQMDTVKSIVATHYNQTQS